MRHRERAQSPFFTILMPVYNHAEFIGGALDSVLAQSHNDWEAVVVDDGSTDASGTVIQEYAAKDSRIRYYRKENGGTATALNLGLQKARGQWICWLSSDDMFLPDKLAIHARYIDEYPAIKAFHSGHYILDSDRRELLDPGYNWRTIMPVSNIHCLRFFWGNYVNGISIAIKSSCFDDAGYFDPELRNAQDVDMWMRISLRTPFFFIPEKTCIWRKHAESGTSKAPSFGVFDSGVGLIKLLNDNTFDSFFSELDLSFSPAYHIAVNRTIRIIFENSTFINRIGYAHGLFERMREFISVTGNRDLESIKVRLKSLLDTRFVWDGARDAVIDFLDSDNKDFVYRQTEPKDILLSFFKELIRKKRLQQAEDLGSYLHARPMLSKYSGITPSGDVCSFVTNHHH